MTLVKYRLYLAVVKSSKNLKKKKLWINSKKTQTLKSYNSQRAHIEIKHLITYPLVDKKQLSWRYRNRRRRITRPLASTLALSL